jgi:hypothetical protein
VPTVGAADAGIFVVDLNISFAARTLVIHVNLLS